MRAPTRRRKEKTSPTTSWVENDDSYLVSSSEKKDVGGAAAAAAAAAGGDIELMDVETGDSSNNIEFRALVSKREMELKIPKPKWGRFDTLIFGVVCLTMTAAVVSLMIYQDTIIIISMTISLVTSTYTAYLRKIIREMEPLRGIVNDIRMEVNHLHNENKTLVRSNDELEFEVKRLEEKERELDAIAQRQGADTTRFVDHLKENKMIMKEINEEIEGRILQDLISIIFKADRDRDYLIDPEEIEMLCFRLENNLVGVTFDPDRFKAAMKRKGYNLNAIIDIVDNVFDKTIPRERKIFKIEVKGLRPGDL